MLTGESRKGLNDSLQHRAPELNLHYTHPAQLFKTRLDSTHHCAAGVSPRACSRETPPPLDAPAPRDLLELAGAGACWFLICSSVSRRSATVAKEALAGRELELPTDDLSKRGEGRGDTRKRNYEIVISTR